MVEPARWSLDDGVPARVREVLALPAFAPGRIPPDRRSWFPGFLARSYTAAGRRSKTRREAEEPDMLEMWEHGIARMAREGASIVGANVWMTREVFDATEKDQRRGEDYRPSGWLQLIVSADMRELLLDALLTPSPAEWGRFGKWFGPPEGQDGTRTAATMSYPRFARWDPALAPDEEAMLDALLDDPAPTVRWSAAMVLAISGAEPVGTRTVMRLADAIDDREWVWSYEENYYDDSIGCHQAAEVAAGLGSRALAARPAILRLIADQASIHRVSGRLMFRIRDALAYLDGGTTPDHDQDQAIVTARQGYTVALPKPQPATPIRDYDPGTGIAFQGDLAIVPGPPLEIARPEEFEPIAGHLFIQRRSVSGHHHFIVLSEQSEVQTEQGVLRPSARMVRLPPERGTVTHGRASCDARLGALVVEHGPAVLRHATRDAIRIPVGTYYIHQRFDSADWETVT